jgi:ribosomal protein L30/L7E
MKQTLLAVIRIRGNVHETHKTALIFKLLNLTNQNTLVVLEDSPTIRGMLKQIQSYVTWGVLDEAVYTQLKEKRKPVTGKNHVFRLSPPIKGFGRKGIKTPFSLKGALGNRKEKINDLLTRMM